MAGENRQAEHGHPATTWFVVLEQAREQGDSKRAAQATRELKRLGVEVRFQRPRSKREAPA